MKNQEQNSNKEALRKEILKNKEARLLAEDQARTKAYSAKEQVIEKAQKLKDAQRAEERAREEIKELAKEKSRKEVYLAHEKIIAAEQEARRLKNPNSPQP